MNEVLLFKVFLSFVVGSMFAALTLYVAARFGPKWGGIISGVPSTSAVALFFIAYTQSSSDAAIAVVVIPAALSGSLIFVLLNVLLSRKNNYLLALFISTAVWFIIALPLGVLKNLDLAAVTIIYLLVSSIIHILLNRISTGQDNRVTPKHQNRDLAIRSIFAGSVIAAAVYASNLFGPQWGGTLASFPAMFFSTFIIFQRDRGWKYTADLSKTIPTGLFSVIPYVWAVHYLYPQYGFVLGTVFAYIASFIGLAAVYFIGRLLKT
jgi:uncharacterized membrane protein (GlpM family)